MGYASAMTFFNKKRIAVVSEAALKTSQPVYHFMKFTTRPNGNTRLSMPRDFPPVLAEYYAMVMKKKLEEMGVDLSCMPADPLRKTLPQKLIESYYWNGGDIPKFNSQELVPGYAEMWEHCRSHCTELVEYAVLFNYLLKNKQPEIYEKALRIFLNGKDEIVQKPKVNRSGFYLLAPCKRNRKIVYKIPKSKAYKEIEWTHIELKKKLKEQKVDIPELASLINDVYLNRSGKCINNVFNEYFIRKTKSIKGKDYVVCDSKYLEARKFALELCLTSHKEFFEFLHILGYLKENEAIDQRCGALLKDLLSRDKVCAESVAVQQPTPVLGENQFVNCSPNQESEAVDHLEENLEPLPTEKYSLPSLPQFLDD